MEAIINDLLFLAGIEKNESNQQEFESIGDALPFLEVRFRKLMYEEGWLGIEDGDYRLRYGGDGRYIALSNDYLRGNSLRLIGTDFISIAAWISTSDGINCMVDRLRDTRAYFVFKEKSLVCFRI